MLLRFLKGLLKPAKHKLDEKTANALTMAERLAASGDVARALLKCQDVTPCFSDHPEVLVARSGYLAQIGSFDESESCIRQALSIAPDHHRALFLLGSIYLARGEAVRALPLFERVEAAGSADEALLANYGVALHSIARVADAKVKFEAALACNPDFMAAALPYIQILMEQKLFDDALSLLDRLAIIFPADCRLLRLRGFILYKHFFQPEEADQYLERAEELGESEAQFWNERGECARDQGDSERALRYFEKALAIAPGHPVVTFNMALLSLMLENYETAWPGYEARFDGSNLGNIRLPAPQWDGSPLNGAHLAILGEQGIGDEIMFASCLTDLPDNSSVTLSCAEKLLGIFQASFPKVTCVAREKVGEGTFSSADLAIAAGSLPSIFRRTRDSFPRHPYLRAPEDGRKPATTFLTSLPAGLKVGISWRGGTEMSRLRLRTLPLSLVAKLLNEPDVTWVNLQYGDCERDLDVLQTLSSQTLHHPKAILADYAATAALVEGLDLVISVCTAIIHLGGALGKEVWVLAPKVPEWRYGLGFQCMPWYRNVEIFRQKQSGNWDEPLSAVRNRLRVAATKK